MKPMVSGKACEKLLLLASCLLAIGLPGPLYGQSAAEKVLLAKAQSLVAHDHLELAIQTWQQILLSDSTQREALIGIAKAEIQLGKPEEAQKYTQRLRDLGSSSADLAQIQAMPRVQPRSERLANARRLATQGKSADAMKVYRDLFPHGPPAGDMALEYYETEAAIPEERREATDHLRELSTQFSADPRYAIVLGRILTYDPKTRAQGIALLSRFDSSPDAQRAIKQASVWSGDDKKPVAAANVEPGNSLPAQPAAKDSSADPMEGSAYRDLNGGRLDEAQQGFAAVLEKHPHDAGALSGLGYVAMKKGNFADAVDYLEKARAAGAPKLEGTLSTARFWSRMAQASSEQKAGDAQAALKDYRDALAMKPTNHDAQEALAGALIQGGNREDAIEILQREVAENPASDAAWRSLFVAQAQTANWRGALSTSQRMPKSVEVHLEGDPEYLRYLIQGYLATNRKLEADRATQRALALPFPDHGRNLSLEKQLQYAALLVAVQRGDAGIRLYRQALDVDPENVGAWRALVAAEHQLGKDDEAIATLRNMPRSAYEQSQNDAGFLALLGSIYQSSNQLEKAEKFLEKAVSVSGSSQPGLELQLADVYIAEGEQRKAYSIYRRELDRNPNNAAAWRGLLTALHQANHDREALHELATMPESARAALEQDSSYLQTLASIQSAVGQDKAALQTFDLIMQVYRDQQTEEPVDMQVQYGWLLLKAGDDRRLYSVVSKLADTPDLTETQQGDFHKLWASWSVRRANTALAAGQQQLAIAILEKAAQAFPGDADIYNTLAGAYLQTGQSKRAVAIYASLDLSHATLDQYHGAVGAALAAHDLKQAEVWLRAALELYKDDASLLKMAAQYEQARGDSGRAAAYYRAALDAMGPASPAEIFSHTASPGQPGEVPSRGNNGPAHDLMRLLAPPASSNQNGNNGSDQVRGEFKREADVSWRDHPQVRPTTLGDFGVSGSFGAEDRDEASSASSPEEASGSLGDLTAAEDSRVVVPPPPVPVKRVSLELPTRRAYVEAQDTVQSKQSSPGRGKKRSSSPAGDGANASEAAETLQDAVKSMQTPSRRAAKDPFGENGGDHNDGSSMQTDSAPFLSPAPVAGTSQVALATLPPLTGTAATQPPLTPREQIEQQLAVLQGASSNWLGGTSMLDYRSGQPGYDRLAMYSGQLETSSTLGPGIRTTFILKPVLLDAGQATGTDTIQQGTLPLTSTPYVQSAAGTAGEFQLQTANVGVRVGTTPRGFLVQNYTGGISIHPVSRHFGLELSRDPILDTQLSFAGLRDEGSVTPSFIGNTWGGVMTNSAELQIHSGDAQSGWYIQGGGQYLTGLHVATNKRIDGDGGAYWTVWHNPDFGGLVLGVNFFGMHYQRNLRYFTYGQGGYFSPGAYMLAAVPVTFNGHYGPKLHYRVTGSLGMQAFQEDSAPFFPLDPAYQAAKGNPAYPERTSVGGNYNLETEASYPVTEHWYVGAYTDFNNSRDYASDKVGFFVRFLLRPQPLNQENGPTGLFPVQGMRPLQTP
jgi:tetratricopeptide (TPR) repeat protein